MPKAYLSEGEPEREPGQIALQVCRLSACARASCAYVWLPVMSARLVGSPLGIYYASRMLWCIKRFPSSIFHLPYCVYHHRALVADRSCSVARNLKNISRKICICKKSFFTFVQFSAISSVLWRLAPSCFPLLLFRFWWYNKLPLC